MPKKPQQRNCWYCKVDVPEGEYWPYIYPDPLTPQRNWQGRHSCDDCVPFVIYAQNEMGMIRLSRQEQKYIPAVPEREEQPDWFKSWLEGQNA